MKNRNLPLLGRPLAVAVAALFALLSLFAPQLGFAQATPLGDEFQVNTYTTNGQAYPSVAMDADGDFVVAWHSQGSAGTDPSGGSVQGQRYASDGSTVGGELQVNTYTTFSQTWPSVALSADGDFVVVWHSYGSNGTDSDSFSVRGQRYAADGSTVDGEFQVNTYTTSYQGRSSVAMAADGGFIAVWRSTGSGGTDSSSFSVQGQRYAVEADLAITNDDGLTSASPGDTLTYTIVASNAGPGDASSVSVTDTFPADLTCSWTSFADGGAIGNSTSSGDLDDMLTMPVGSSVTYTVDCETHPSNEGTVSNTAEISSPQTDPVPGNNSATDLTTVTELFADGFESGNTSAWTATVP